MPDLPAWHGCGYLAGSATLANLQRRRRFDRYLGAVELSFGRTPMTRLAGFVGALQIAPQAIAQTAPVFGPSKLHAYGLRSGRTRVAGT